MNDKELIKSFVLEYLCKPYDSLISDDDTFNKESILVPKKAKSLILHWLKKMKLN